MLSYACDRAEGRGAQFIQAAVRAGRSTAPDPMMLAMNRMGYDAMVVRARDLSAARVEEAHALGLAVIPWTVNDPGDMEQVLALRVDGMITDYPDRLRSLLQSRGIAVPAPTPVQ